MKSRFWTLLISMTFAGMLWATGEKYVGGDISCLMAYEASNTVYLDAQGKKIPDLLAWLHTTAGWNTFRVRLFVNPGQTSVDGSRFQTLDYVTELGARIKAEGAQFMLDIHYSDTWVDATHIQAPVAWKNCTPEQMADSVADYTMLVLEHLKANSATPDLVQVGNEIMYGMCGIQVHPYAKAEDNWDAFGAMIKAGCLAVREACPEAKIIIHTDRPSNTSYNHFYYSKLQSYDVDFDVIGLSYYPFWHGYMTDEQVVNKQDKNNLHKAVKQLAVDFPGKEVHIVETAYNNMWWPTTGVNYDTRDLWACASNGTYSGIGQYNMIHDLMVAMADCENLSGINYWFPEEAGNGDAVNWTTKEGLVIDKWLNRGLWNPNKSGTGHAIAKGENGQSVPELLGTFLNGGSQNIVATGVMPKAEKMLIDGEIVIRKGERWYNQIGMTQRKSAGNSGK